jgi:DNA-cytosine methyltransferase
VASVEADRRIGARFARRCFAAKTPYFRSFRLGSVYHGATETVLGTGSLARTALRSHTLAKAAFQRLMATRVSHKRNRRVAKPRSTAVVVVEDNSARSHRRSEAGVTRPGANPLVLVRLHRVETSGPTVVEQRGYRTNTRQGNGRRVTIALAMIDRASDTLPIPFVVVAGTAYGSNPSFLAGLLKRGLDFASEIRPSTRVVRTDGQNVRRQKPAGARKLLRGADWKHFQIAVPGASGPVEYHAADLGGVRLRGAVTGRLVAAQIGGIPGLHRRTVFVLTSQLEESLERILQAAGWARWIRAAVRREERKALQPQAQAARPAGRDAGRVETSPVPLRSNILLSRRQDESRPWEQLKLSLKPRAGHSVVGSLKRVNVVELFAGAGGLGLGFLMAGTERTRYRMVFSGEAHPIYAQTLRRNHDALRAIRRQHDLTPGDLHPIDLRTPEALKEIKARAKNYGGTHLLIGGPPCQGFSSANRNSWHGDNPHNGLVGVFLRYVESLRPLMFLMENVQGILWTPQAGKSATASVMAHLARRCAAMGYTVFPKLLDAVWYGVPQHRSRFFLLGIRADLGHNAADFGSWGPFPLPSHGPGTERPYVTVRDAIEDLPSVNNGEDREVVPYRKPDPVTLKGNEFLKLMRSGASGRMISDHVTSRHADYVIDRYKAIPPGGNWEAIANKLTNYTAVERTHSNIYRRLTWDNPSITIGHYRKSMLVHPRQHRGLSLREASRLQSFPDWFRFAGSANGNGGGLVHKQQQLANAVCPLVAKALAEFILTL